VYQILSESTAFVEDMTKHFDVFLSVHSVLYIVIDYTLRVKLFPNLLFPLYITLNDHEWP